MARDDEEGGEPAEALVEGLVREVGDSVWVGRVSGSGRRTSIHFTSREAIVEEKLIVERC